MPAPDAALRRFDMRTTLLTALTMALAACATSSPEVPTASELKLIEPQVKFVQLVGPADLQYPQGEIEVKYGLRIVNRSAETLTLRRIRVEPVNIGGPYIVRRNSYFFQTSVPGDQTTDVAFWAKAVAEGDAYALDARAPVAVRGVAYFDSPAGPFRVVFAGNFSQLGGAVEGQ